MNVHEFRHAFLSNLAEQSADRADRDFARLTAVAWSMLAGLVVAALLTGI